MSTPKYTIDTFEMLDKLRAAAIKDSATKKISNSICDEICDWCENKRLEIGNVPKYCTADDCPESAMLEESMDNDYTCPACGRVYEPLFN